MDRRRDSLALFPRILPGIDPTTALANRATFSDRLALTLAEASLAQRSVSVLVMALDDIVTVTDGLGTVVGDYVLAAVAARLRLCLGDRRDRLARVGPTQFAILLIEPIQSRQAALLAEDIIEVLRAPVPLPEEGEVLLGVTIGIATSQPQDRAPAALLHQAEAALRLARRSGRWSYALFEPALHAAALRHLTDAADLFRAVEHQQFSVVYQPIVDLRTGALRGAEALARWHHPRRGFVPPAEFIPTAEETSLILAIGRWVLREACALAHQFSASIAARPALTISVNLSAVQLLSPDLVEETAQILRQVGLAPAQLILEITESVLVRDATTVIDHLRDLKRLGVRLALDDFGTGYSSYGYLRRLPIDILKIDRQFTNGLGDGQAADSDEAAVIGSIIGLGHRLGFQVVAEGIETPGQARCLRALDCDLAQGYYFARPLAGPTFTQYCVNRAWPL